MGTWRRDFYPIYALLEDNKTELIFEEYLKKLFDPNFMFNIFTWDEDSIRTLIRDHFECLSIENEIVK